MRCSPRVPQRGDDYLAVAGGGCFQHARPVGTMLVGSSCWGRAAHTKLGLAFRRAARDSTPVGIRVGRVMTTAGPGGAIGGLAAGWWPTGSSSEHDGAVLISAVAATMGGIDSTVGRCSVACHWRSDCRRPSRCGQPTELPARARDGIILMVKPLAVRHRRSERSMSYPYRREPEASSNAMGWEGWRLVRGSRSMRDIVVGIIGAARGLVSPSFGSPLSKGAWCRVRRSRRGPARPAVSAGIDGQLSLCMRFRRPGSYATTIALCASDGLHRGHRLRALVAYGGCFVGVLAVRIKETYGTSTIECRVPSR